MKTVFGFRKITNEMWKYKKIVGISIIMFVVVSGVFGIKKIQTGADVSLVEEQQEYEDNLAEYDELIEETEENIKISKTQIKKQQEYCDNSVYMQLDSQKIYVAEVQYSIKSEANIGFIISSLIMYINEGSLRNQIHELYQDISIEYLKELISCSTSGNVLHVAVMAPEEQQARDLMQVIKEQVVEQKEQIALSQGEYVIQELDSVEYTKADAAVMTTQNTALNALKNLKNSLTDYKKKLVDQKNNRKYYVENNKPAIPEMDSPIKIMLKFMIFGIALGILLPAAWFSLRYILGNTVKGKEELLAAGFPVFGTLDRMKADAAELAMSAFDIQMLAEKEKSTDIFINCLTEEENVARIIIEYREKWESKGLHVTAGTDLHKSEEVLRRIVEAGHCVLIVELGRTTYAQVEQQLQLAKKFGITIWGCIVVG